MSHSYQKGTNYTIRPLTKKDEPFLWEMLYQAIYVSKGQAAPPRKIVRQPELAWYVEGWGRAGDCGFLASAGAGNPIGAVWLRLPQGEHQGYGYVNDDTPELSMAILPAYRGQGIGTQLFTCLFAATCAAETISLSVSAKNPARQLYERHGFVVVGQSNGSLTMIREG